MPFDDIQQQTGAMSDLAAMPPSGGEAPTGPAMGGAGGSGGPGIDTPQEQQAVQMLLQGMQTWRQATEADPSIRPMIDKILQDAFLQVADHYGYGEDAKLALKQAQMMKNRAQASKLSGAGPPTSAPPMAGPPAQGAPSAPGPSMAIEY